MRGKHRSIMMVAVVSIIILAGCTNKFEDSISDWAEELKNDGIHKEISLTQEIGSASDLLLENEVGSIEVTATTDDQMTVSATFSFPNKPSRESKYQEIIDNTEISVVTRGDQLEITTHPKGNEKTDMWKWVKKEYGFSQFSIDYKVELPDSVNRYKIQSDVGRIKLHNLQGIYDIRSDVGTIYIEGAQIQGESKITSDVGSLQLGINQMDSESTLIAKTDVGSIKAILAETLQYSLKVSSDVGRVVGAPKGESDMNGGGPLITLTSDVGSITVESP
ncbi:hypothetical protein ACP8HI_19555 [Paenibacillus sp. FA6]|uniref:hypothetical protein n=1 Tax=Paenibacillus sp. FA6 TaxID=3413029 RepID=UPI003F65FD06